LLFLNAHSQVGGNYAVERMAKQNLISIKYS